VFFVEVVSVVDVVKGDGGLAEDVKVGWVGFAQALSGEYAVDGDGRSTDGFVS
jgi:hypothetical protein